MLADLDDRNSRSCRESLILEHLGRVRSIAHRIQRRLPQHVSLDDLISAGILGLIQAVDNFDPRHEAKLSTYADTKIRGAILDSLRQEDWAPRQGRKRLKDIENAILAAQQKLQRVPTEEEIAEELRLSLSAYQSWLSNLQGLHLACSPGSGEGDAIEYVADAEDATPSHILERREMEQILAGELERLPQNEKTIMLLYYERELAVSEIAQVVGMKATRVSQIRCQAITRLRANLARRLKQRGPRKS